MNTINIMVNVYNQVIKPTLVKYVAQNV